MKTYNGGLLVDDIKTILVNLSVEDINFLLEWKVNKVTIKEEQEDIALMTIDENIANIPKYYEGIETNINDYILWYFYEIQEENGSFDNNVKETFWNIYYMKSAGLKDSQVLIDSGLKYLSTISSYNNIEKIIKIWARKEL